MLVAGTGDEPIAAVLDRRVLDGVEWIRVQVGRGYAQDFVTNGWAPQSAEVEDGGKRIHLDPTYEPYTPTCPTEPTVGDLDGMLPLEAVYCFGSRPLTFSKVQIRTEGDEASAVVSGGPEWLVSGGDRAMYWLPERVEAGSIRVYIDPAQRLVIPEHQWLEVTGQLNYPAAADCDFTSSEPEILNVDGHQESVDICRGHFVVTSFRLLTEAEIPVQLPTSTPGPRPDAVANVDVREITSPLKYRYGPAAVWTGSQMIVWGGSEEDRDIDTPLPLKDGAAYSPTTRSWSEIDDGPLTPRSSVVSTWTGSQMLVWGGWRGEREEYSDGAPYDPVSDTWRPIADAPIKWHLSNANAWTGTAWWIATESDGHVEVAQYEPATDTWMKLPSVDDQDWENMGIAWTGSELILKSHGGIYRIEPGASQWRFEQIEFTGPLIWANGLICGVGFDNATSDPLGWEPFWHPVAWDPVTSAKRDISSPPDSVYGATWTGQYIAYFESRLAYDPVADSWIRLDRPGNEAYSWVERTLGYDGAARVWADDRLITWGGADGCSFMSEPHPIGYELIPAWPTASSDATVAAARLGYSNALDQATAGTAGSIVTAC